MKRHRIINTLLAFLVLLQTVAVLSAVPRAAAQFANPDEHVNSAKPDASTAAAHTDAAKPCHQESMNDRDESGPGCCDTLNNPDCALACAHMAAAVPGFTELESMSPAAYGRVPTLKVTKQLLPSGHFRPPRSS